MTGQTHMSQKIGVQGDDMCEDDDKGEDDEGMNQSRGQDDCLKVWTPRERSANRS